GEGRQAVGAQQRRAEMREQPEILALLQRLDRLAANRTPVGRRRRPVAAGVERLRLAEQPEGVERRQQLRVLEIVAARLFRGDGLEQRVLALPTSTHS